MRYCLASFGELVKPTRRQRPTTPQWPTPSEPWPHGNFPPYKSVCLGRAVHSDIGTESVATRVPKLGLTVPSALLPLPPPSSPSPLTQPCCLHSPRHPNETRLRSPQPGLKKWESPLLDQWRCPRRLPWRGRGPNPEPLFSCLTCSLTCVCRQCARTCHQGHDIGPCSRT